MAIDFHRLQLVNISKWLPQLRRLDLVVNDLEQLPEEIRLLTNLRQLDLSGHRFSEQAKERIRLFLPDTEIKF